jgi:hypothetical protein
MFELHIVTTGHESFQTRQVVILNCNQILKTKRHIYLTLTTEKATLILTQ